MKNNERNSRKRLNSLILLVAFTAVMLIVSTYAWFSTQKNVTLTGLKGVVNVAEGLQISLDAEHWVNSINFDHFEQTSASSWTVKATSPTTYLNSGATFQAPATGVTNVVPTELLPASTTGYKSTNDGINQTAVKFYRGSNTETIKLMDDTKLLTEDSSAGYFAFDLFLMNTSAGSLDDVLQLDPVSDVTGINESAGVQNTARVAFALYNTTGDMTISGSNTAADTPAEIIAGTSTDETIKDIAIWEPNANAHTDTIVASLANTLKLDATVKTKYSTLTEVKDTDNNYVMSKFAATDKLPTYALTSASVPGTAGEGKNVHIKDVYDWRLTDSASTAATGVKEQFTLQTDAYAGTGSAATQRAEAINLKSTGKWETARSQATPADPSEDTFVIKPNQYQKIRVYFWMEGQDPDCINAASLGGGLTLDIGFSKPGQDSSSSAS